MVRLKSNRIRCSRGFTILEVIIAALITGILATASFRFYTSMHNQTEAQYEVSELQHQCRASVHEIKKTLRLAGFKLVAHPAVEINGDSLAIYFSETQPVDTVLYFLQPFADWEYVRWPDLQYGHKLFRLVRQRNSQPIEPFTDFIVDVNFEKSTDSKSMRITITAQTSKKDETYDENNGFRTWTLEEQVSLRNVIL
ncbi:MAG: prepilin-type N-terminal cleavage/methylation domain-containing protein [Candidatus Zixiibacteriota bacterium]|nr:MAG: prepilin-type N-terminal cleavage/methylation domain-containing protein [candidate division Zixibacteria bacterium]